MDITFPSTFFKMSAANLFNKVRSTFRRDPAGLDLNDTTPIDFSDELVEDEPPRFNHLKVVVSGETPGFAAGAPANGVAVSTLVVSDDDDSLIEASSMGSGSGFNTHPCDNCTKRREMLRNKKVMKKLVVAAVLYLLFMTAEIIGRYMPNKRLDVVCRLVQPLTESENLGTNPPRRRRGLQNCWNCPLKFRRNRLS